MPQVMKPQQQLAFLRKSIHTLWILDALPILPLMNRGCEFPVGSFWPS
jgi:hypothetical protein